MILPADKHQAPNGGWKYTDPRTGVPYVDFSLEAIFSRVWKSWDGIGLEIPHNWKDVIASEICEQNPHLECREEGESARHMTMDDVLRFGSTVKKWLSDGGQFVSQEEADRRAQICIKCPYNKPVTICFGCAGAVKWMAERTGWPSTRFDHQLQSCEKCLCTLRLKVQMPMESLDSTGIEYPSFCWQAKPQQA